MDNLLLTLAVGVIFVVSIHSLLRFFSRLTSTQAALLTLFFVCGVYIPLLVLDWPGIDVFAIQFAIYGITVYLLVILHHQSIQQNLQINSGDSIKKKWHWAPLLIVGFFVVVVSVDSVFITIAQQGSDSLLRGLLIPKPKSGGNVTSFFPGIVEHNFHEKGDQYNQFQQRLTEQRQRGWDIKYGWLVQPVAKKNAMFQILMKNAKQQVITQANITGVFQRGNTSKQDKQIVMKEVEAGKYQAEVILDYPGRWNLILKITSPQGDYNINATTDISE